MYIYTNLYIHSDNLNTQVSIAFNQELLPPSSPAPFPKNYKLNQNRTCFDFHFSVFILISIDYKAKGCTKGIAKVSVSIWYSFNFANVFTNQKPPSRSVTERFEGKILKCIFCKVVRSRRT